jgi:para-aminobenzoate synthetase component 1
MIVDLARNDLGRVAAPGSVRVEARHELESYATVHHLVATISAQLAPGRDRFDAIRALHPGGSITGAPKIRAMQIIAELEPEPRQAYTGALGYLGDDGDVDLAIAIRTITCANGLATYHVGAGITWDSDPKAEHEETLQKGRAMRRALDGGA